MTDLETPESLAWAELQRRGSVRSRYVRDLEAEISEELARCFDPYVHEHDIRPYGAIICRELPHLEHLGRVFATDGLAPDLIRSLADGRRSLVLVVKGQAPQLLLLHDGVDTDQDYASRAVWVDGVIISNDEHGIVRIVTDSSVTLVEGRRWIVKDLVFEAAEDIVQVVPAASAMVVRRLLDLCHHRLSPARIGATLLYCLTDREDVGRRRSEGLRLTDLQLSILNEAEEPLILHQARYRDGALLIAHDGALLAVNVILRPTKRADRAVPAATGTRHTSSARHTYDCPDVLAFVVSTEGPVTVFSDGQRIAELRMGDPPMPPDDAKSRLNISDRVCRRCGASLTIRSIFASGHNAHQTVTCPACDRPTATASCWRIEAFLRKTTQTIQALEKLRARKRPHLAGPASLT